MADFLFALAKINLAMAAAILMVALLRRPIRAAFHAPVAYALWLLVPAAALACLLPPRMVTIAAHPVPVQIPLVTRHALQTGIAAHQAPFDWGLLLFAAWAVGVAAMLSTMAWAQFKFHKAERQGVAGPAVAGFFRPRIIIPAGFSAQFSASEQVAVLAHEQAHLTRQDARVNAAVALLRCLCWFNPLMHVGAMWLRRDQELACDAAALTQVSRIDYANALVKSQMRAVVSPLGCAWPGAEHPLTERVALLKFGPLGPVRRWTGMGLVAALTLFAGLGAWAAQPAQNVPHPTFTGKFFWAKTPFDNGPSLTMSLESGQDDKFDGPPKDKLNIPYDRVVMHFPYGMAQADDAVMDFRLDSNMAEHKTITLKGNVRLGTGPIILKGGLRGETLVFDALTGMLTMNGKSYPSGMPKYVPCTKNCKRKEF
ncbi:MAG TPA: M56 family metallopeptidase [Rhizomicrobium sp.]|nr:M56 family metallopeptidase [Rhizomicrobium sp.]